MYFALPKRRFSCISKLNKRGYNIHVSHLIPSLCLLRRSKHNLGRPPNSPQLGGLQPHHRTAPILPPPLYFLGKPKYLHYFSHILFILCCQYPFFFVLYYYINQNLHYSYFSGFIQEWKALHWGTVIYNFSYFLQIIDYYLIFIQEVYKLLWYIFMLYKCHLVLTCTPSRITWQCLKWNPNLNDSGRFL